ncbi:methylated-DNA--[protein]-cysteine S-methyltransferase [Microlunatus elymi]|uniref:Methylated-DNA--[protein]-cysteine S-methyltransferase n=1 Tax=Microlunatus elymi TaxID=2596828 RepID=A0A516PXG8_9ACTN|nr:methylated-DNA--[protein]-cysteine S-methyltransferase [Microlunatus elymi]QDP95874.1 methylated-DNA--[protein]-cysteine S-methyltransferase [Microlunatus elymi]
MINNDPTTSNLIDSKINFGDTDSIAGAFGYLWRNDADGPVIIGSGWTADPEELIALVHPSLRPIGEVGRANSKIIDDAVRDYGAGRLEAIDVIRVEQHSGPFIEAAWDALRATPPGHGSTYTELAGRAGRPAAVRAAAAACAYNAAALFVPCHRIVRRDGRLGGFRYGLDIKRTLLAHEA